MRLSAGLRSIFDVNKISELAHHFFVRRLIRTREKERGSSHGCQDCCEEDREEGPCEEGRCEEAGEGRCEGSGEARQEGRLRPRAIALPVGHQERGRRSRAARFRRRMRNAPPAFFCPIGLPAREKTPLRGAQRGFPVRFDAGSAGQTRRSTISFLSSPMALAGERPFGHALAQFMMVWQR